jgi:hypothetical protein
MRKPRFFKTISPEVAAAIFELHEKHPKLGHDGLLKLLEEDSGFDVNSDELTVFLDEHNVHGEKWVRVWGGSITPGTGGAAGAVAVGGG